VAVVPGVRIVTGRESEMAHAEEPRECEPHRFPAQDAHASPDSAAPSRLGDFLDCLADNLDALAQNRRAHGAD
jgi:hypothetical protein